MRQDSIKNRQKILDVFSKAVEEGDPDLLTMSEIVRRTGLGRGTVYRHFTSTGDVAYAYLEAQFVSVFSSYEPEWIKGGARVIRKRFHDFLLEFATVVFANRRLLRAPGFHGSGGRKLVQTELRRKIFVTATLLSPHPLKPIILSKWVDVIAYCVEVEHLTSVPEMEVDLELSVQIAIGLMEQTIVSQDMS